MAEKPKQKTKKYNDLCFLLIGLWFVYFGSSKLNVYLDQSFVKTGRSFDVGFPAYDNEALVYCIVPIVFGVLFLVFSLIRLVKVFVK